MVSTPLLGEETMMKSIILALTLVTASFALAQGAPTEIKVNKKQAKMECLKQNPKLKGKALAHCVKERTK